MSLKTREEVKADFTRNGISIGSWAKANGFKREDVYAVLNGVNKAKYGRAHAIAVALRLKDGVVTTPEAFHPVAAVSVGVLA